MHYGLMRVIIGTLYQFLALIKRMIKIKSLTKKAAITALWVLCSGFLLAEDQKLSIETIDAKNISTNSKGNLLLRGDVYIKTNLLEFWSNEAVYNKSDQSFVLNGEVKVLSKKLSINSDALEANLANQTFLLEKSSLNLEGKAFGNAEEFKILASGNVELLNTSLNTCSESDPLWKISSKKIRIIKDSNNAIMEGVKLEIGSLPVFYIPFIRTVIGNQRLSGFLSPSLKQGKDGIDISLPYYLNLAPNFDLIFSPRLIEDRGEGIETKFRYLNYSSNGEISISGFKKDKKYLIETGGKGSRWSGSWTHRSEFNKKLFTEVQYEAVSDDLYFRDISNDLTGTIKKNILRKKVKIYWKGRGLSVGGFLQESESLTPFAFNDYKSSPTIFFNYSIPKEDLTFRMSSSFSRFKPNKSLYAFSGLSKIKRTLIQPSIEYKNYFKSSKINIAFGSDETKYKIDSNDFNQSSPWLSVAYKVQLEKVNKDRTNILNPQIKIIHVKNNQIDNLPNIDSRNKSQNFSNLFNRKWSSGPDKVLDRDRVILGMQHYSSSKISGFKNYFSLGQAFFLEDNNSSFSQNRAPIIGEFRSEFSNNLQVSTMIEINPSDHLINSGFFNLTYKPEENKLIEIRSSFRRDYEFEERISWEDRNQPSHFVELLSQWPITKNFSVFSKVMKDIEDNSSKDLLFGFQYSTCCLKVGIMKRKWEEEDLFAWKEKFQNPFFAISQGYNPTRNRDNIYIFLEFTELGRFGKELSDVVSSTRIQ